MGNQAAGRVLTSDATGKGTWQEPASFALPFKGTNSADQAVTSGANYLVNFDTKEYDYGNLFNASTFSATVAGLYHFDATVY